MSQKSFYATAFGAASILFASQLAVGSSGVFARLALSGTGPMMVSALRLSIASAILLAVWAGSKKQIVSRRHELLFVLCGLALAVHFYTWMASLCYVTVATATLIISATPLWTTLYDLIVLKHKPSAKFWLGFILAGAGTLLIVGGPESGVVMQRVNTNHIGELLAAIGGLAFAFYLIAIRAVTENYSTLTMITRTYSWAAVFLWLAALAMGEQMPGANMQSWTGIVAMALVSQMFGHTCLNLSLKTFATRIVALATLLEPVIAGLLAAIFFGENLSLLMLVGAAILLVALALVLSDNAAEQKVEELAVPL